jgi:hypothetical protein
MGHGIIEHARELGFEVPTRRPRRRAHTERHRRSLQTSRLALLPPPGPGQETRGSP